MVHFRSRGIGLEQCIQLMKNSRNGTIWFHGEREKNTKLFFYHYLTEEPKKSPLILLLDHDLWQKRSDERVMTYANKRKER